MDKKENTNRIVSVALKVFSEYGYAGSSMDDIAKKAKVNKATIYYHIGNKERLYIEVIKTFVGSISSMINEIIDEKASSKQNIRKFIKTITSAPDYVKPVFRLMLREVSTGFATIPEDAIKYIIELFKLVRKLIILPGIERDSLNEKDPFLSHAFLLSSTLFLNVIPEVREKIISKADVKGNFSKSRDEIIDQYIELIFYGFYGKNEEEV